MLFELVVVESNNYYSNAMSLINLARIKGCFQKNAKEVWILIRIEKTFEK